MPNSLTKIWAYAVEPVGAALICTIIWLTIGAEEVRVWQLEKKADILAAIAIAAGVSAAIFAAYFALLSTDFGRKIRMQGAAAEYASAFAFPMILFLISAGALEFLRPNPNLTFSRFVTFLLCYCFVNCVTMIRNVIGLVRLWQDVDRGGVA